MKNFLLAIVASISMIAFINSCSADDSRASNETTSESLTTRRVKPVTTLQSPYNIRFGLLSRSGQKLLSGNFDVGSFVAVNLDTGDTYYTYYSGGFQSLPAYLDEQLPAGTYEFYAEQGQGGWVGYGSTTISLNDSLVDSQGFITVYIPILWEE